MRRRWIVETNRHGPAPVYARFRVRGRMAPDGLVYVSGVVSADGLRCFQLMECDNRRLLDEWMAAWDRYHPGFFALSFASEESASA